IIQAVMIEIAAQAIRQRFEKNGSTPLRFSAFVATLSAFTTWLLLGILIIVCLWTILFLALNVFSTGEESFYFSLVAFTTLGFGDVILPDQWRILSGFVAMNGFILFGLNTAIMLEVMIRLRDGPDRL
ncbi:MAG: ion channel, partial [Pseudomonadota bacterium]